jgi:hypothetical protein
MPLLQPSPDETPGASRIVITKVFVRGLTVEAQIGVYKHEKGRAQILVVDVELDVAVTNWNDLTETVNYETIAAKARKVAAEGHRGPVGHLADARLRSRRWPAPGWKNHPRCSRTPHGGSRSRRVAALRLADRSDFRPSSSRCRAGALQFFLTLNVT